MNQSADTSADTLALLNDLLSAARKAGADRADCVQINSISLGASCRMGKLEDIERSESRDLGLRVMIGQRQAIVSASDPDRDALGELVTRAVAMAKATPEDPFCGLADKELLARQWDDLDLYDPIEPATDALLETAKKAEDAARAVPGITNSEGGSAGWGASAVALATSDGFSGGYRATSHSISASVLAGEDQNMERDYDYSSTRHAADLEDAATIGRRAGERTIRRLNPRKAATTQVPVVYDPRAGNSLLGHFSGAINGAAIARGTSFLRDKMDQPVFAAGIAICDDPARKRGLRSRPFDGEGVACVPLALVEDGRLKSWLLDSTTARQLKLATTGHAGRGISSPPSPGATNLYMAAGAVSPDELIADIKQGFYVTELIGMGVNGITGDYSRGAAGFWIEDGEIAYPVNEITIAGNLNDMFAAITPANDLEFHYGTNVPTLRVDGMTIAGA